MNVLNKLFGKGTESREAVIARTSAIGVIINILIAGTKVIIGLIASSIAIISEGVNNAADALTSVLALVGTKLAGKHPDEKHPFGYGRIEYLTSLVISVLILVTGVEMLTSAVKLIFNPTELEISYLSLIIVAVSAVIKFFLGIYTISMGKKTDSKALVAVGLECRNDSFVSLVTIISAIVFLVFDLSIDAYAGSLTSLLIIKAGFDVLRDTVSEILGKKGDEALARKLYHEIRTTNGIVGAADMMLHSYGPDKYSGSVNIEIDHNMTVGEIYAFIHKLQLRIMHEYNVTMVFGIYAVDNDNTRVRELRKNIVKFMKERELIKSFHAVYIEPETERIYCDFIVSYKLHDWDTLRAEFTEYMKSLYPESETVLTVETEFV